MDGGAFLGNEREREREGDSFVRGNVYHGWMKLEEVKSMKM